MKNSYIITKRVVAANIGEALKKERTAEITDISLEKPAPNGETAPRMGFQPS